MTYADGSSGPVLGQAQKCFIQVNYFSLQIEKYLQVTFALLHLMQKCNKMSFRVGNIIDKKNMYLPSGADNLIT